MKIANENEEKTAEEARPKDHRRSSASERRVVDASSFLSAAGEKSAFHPASNSRPAGENKNAHDRDRARERRESAARNNYGSFTDECRDEGAFDNEDIIRVSTSTLAPPSFDENLERQNLLAREGACRKFATIMNHEIVQATLLEQKDEITNHKNRRSAREATSATSTTPRRKNIDELRHVLQKRWNQLARQRLICLHFILNIYATTFLIAHLSKWHNNSKLIVILLFCGIICYCTVLTTLCVLSPLISLRPIFIFGASSTTATLWPVIIWVFCFWRPDYLDTSSHTSTTGDGISAIIIYILASYVCLTFPKRVDMIFGVTASVVHVVFVANYGHLKENQLFLHISATIAILFTVNVFGIILSTAVFQGRELMFRQFDETIERRSTVEYEKERQEQLLLSIIPAHLAARVRKTILNRASKTRESIDGSTEPRLFHDLHVQQHENVSILFADIVNFTPLTAELTAPQLVRFLNELYSRFDEIAQEYQCMRIKILGDCYYCVSGMPVSRPNHADNCVKMGLAMIEAIKVLRDGTSINMDMRIGVHSGSVLCGILGLKKWQYDIWSDDVTIANRMESSGSPGKVHITKATRQLLSNDYDIVQATTTDPYVLAHCAETYFILPYSNSTTAPQIYCTTSAQDIVVAVNGCTVDGSPSAATVDTFKIIEPDRPSQRQKQRRLQPGLPNKSFDRAKSFSFRQYHGTTDDTSRRPKTSYGDSSGRKSSYNSETYVTNVQKQTAKMSKIIEFWGGADTPFANLGRRRTSDHVRAASITMIDNAYKQYHWRKIIVSRNICTRLSCVRYAHGSGGSGAMSLNFTLQLRDQDLQQSFDDNGRPLSSASSTSLAIFVSFCVGIVGSTCIYTSNDSLIAAVFGTIISTLLLINAGQWHSRLSSGKKIKYVAPFTVLENYQYLSACVLPGLSLILSSCLSFIFLASCSISHCKNEEFNVYLFQSVLLLMVSSYRPGFCARCAMVTVFFMIFSIMFFRTDFSREAQDKSELNSTDTNFTILGDSIDLIGLDFNVRAGINVVALIFVCVSTAWLIEYESKVDWLCVASFRNEQDDVETMQDINLILLHNILPAHVASYFLRPERPPDELYHENHLQVCVMFASIPNFKDFWSQWDFSRQLECLRLLNEIVCEFDKLLSKLKYSNVEKIKTVGSTYMAACGLHSNPSVQSDPRRSTAILVEFAFAMMNILDQINRDAFQNFQLRIGMNFGPVIAGVIGAQKPQYDMWGNSVNLASRMDTHGVMGKIHVTQDAADALKVCGYEVESRGYIKVKGVKNEMETFFVVQTSDKKVMSYM